MAARLEQVMESLRERLESQRRAREEREVHARSAITEAGSTATWCRQTIPTLVARLPVLECLDANELASNAEAMRLAEECLRGCADCSGLDDCGSPYGRGQTARVQVFGARVVVDPEPCAYETEAQKRLLVANLLALSNIPARFKDADLQSLSGPGVRRAQQYVRDFERHRAKGRGILFLGGVGTGKTTLACAVVRAVITHHQRSARFIPVVELLRDMRVLIGFEPAAQIRARDAMRSTELAVYDDLGAERATDWVREELYALIDWRYRELAPTIVTTNCSLEELEDRIGQAAVSRLVEMCDVVLVDGPDRRKIPRREEEASS